MLLSLDPETWDAVCKPVTRDAETGMMITGDAVVDAWEREAWEEARRLEQ